jgi:hypothetical protein
MLGTERSQHRLGVGDYVGNAAASLAARAPVPWPRRRDEAQTSLMSGAFQGPEGHGGTRRPMVEDQRDAACGPAGPDVEAPPVR